MTDRDELQKIAAGHGIAPTWRDIWGAVHVVAQETLEEVLTALGVDPDDELRTTAESQSSRRLWQQTLPFVVTTSQPSPGAKLSLHLTSEQARLPHVLRIELEDGSVQNFPITPSQLTLGSIAMMGGSQYEAREWILPPLPVGYHRMALRHGDSAVGQCLLVVGPDRCYEPETWRGGGRLWGAATQLYAVRSERNWGIGDFTDLRVLLELTAARGAGLLGVNPLHALFPHDSERASPYSPSSRLFLNVLYLDIEHVADYLECEPARATVTSAEFQTRLAELRAHPCVDYSGVAAVKHAILDLLHTSFRTRHLARSTDRAQAFHEFLQRGGRALDLHATFEALQEHFHRLDAQCWGWPAWPEEFRDPDNSAVSQLRERLAARIEYFAYLQWQAELQLAAVRRRAADLNVMLYGDLAVSMNRGGAESWTHAGNLAMRMSIGAPPDEFNLSGQDWGLPPILPERMAITEYRHFIAVLRAAMRHLDALRIDHVMGLLRLYWVPQGRTAAEGAYVAYPLEDLLTILALESHRNRCVVIGEDLGTVPDRLRDTLAQHGLLTYRVLYAERETDGSFRDPASYPAQAVVSASTHDLPTLAGFWSGHDLLLRAELGRYPSDGLRQRQIVERAASRARLLLALERDGLLPAGATANPVSMPQVTPDFVCSIMRHLARSPARLLTVQLEDCFLAIEQVNLPGVGEDGYPSWRRKLEVPLEHFSADSRFTALCRALREERPMSPAASPAVRAAGVRSLSIPRATYRLQLNSRFTLNDATALIPYWAALGISHLYCSPYFHSRPGSTHGYDIIDHNRLNPSIGSREDLTRFVAALRAHSMGHLLDIVPNHVGVLEAQNPWWNDVLENGEASIYADFFDIEWQPANALLAGKVLVPVLADAYGSVLERGELQLLFEREHGRFVLSYHNHRLPINPRSYALILRRALALRATVNLIETGRAELDSLLTAFQNLPRRRDAEPRMIRERHRDKEIHKRRLASLCTNIPEVAKSIDAALRQLTGVANVTASFEPLHEILEAQAYRLAYWRVASDEINYRRFFDINDLAALRMDNPAVFEATHGLVLELIASHQLDGLRIDHPDGLFDPQQYFLRLQQRAAALLGAPYPDSSCAELPVYLVAEKITAHFERLPETWAVHGTTGYEFTNVVNGLFVDSGSARRLDRLWRSTTGERAEWPEVVRECKHLILQSALSSELNVLTNALVRIAQANRKTRDFTFNTLRLALIEVIAALPVYRTYVAESASDEDRRYVDWAVTVAKRRSPAADRSIFDFVRSAMLGETVDGANSELRAAARSFAMKFQQVSSPVMAKGVEDTAYYRFTRFVSLNEVGGDPDSFGTSIRNFHKHNGLHAARWPHTMLATSTHDSKRSEDVRARLNVLSEMPAEWRLMVKRWSRLNRSRSRREGDDIAVSPSDEYLLYQTLVGTWPLESPDDGALADYRERIEQYMIKAIREAKLHTSWLNRNEAYEDAVLQFVRGLLADRVNNLFLDALRESLPRIARLGLWNGLAQLLCKLTAPGVPDVYQGNELWDFSLVDPDNRRSVDFVLRRRLLQDVNDLLALPDTDFRRALQSLTAQPEQDRCKLFLLRRTLSFRAMHAGLFRNGAYIPLATTGAEAAHLCAFARQDASGLAVVLVPRLVTGLLGTRDSPPIGTAVWGDTAIRLPKGTNGSSMTGLLDRRSIAIDRRSDRILLRAADALQAFPVALLMQAP